jgi:hypothetical protein
MSIGMSKRMSRSSASLNQRATLKRRKTFTLSPQSVALLEGLSAEDSSGQQSVSAILDRLLLAIGKEKERQENEDKIGKYYDERSDQERQEEIDWGKLATGEFVAIELSKRRG